MSSLVALRDRREAAIQQCADSFAADLLTIEQFDDRVAKLHSATTLPEIEALVADLPAPATPAKSTALVPLSVEPSLSPTKKRFRAWFGSVERSGAWVVPDELAVSAVFGNTVIDFREARFSAQRIVLHANVVFGNLEIIVPPQLAVEADGSSIFGSIESHGGGAVADPERPLRHITGTVVFGNIEITTRLPGESAGDARRRRKRERKQLEASRRAALPPHTNE
jgi:hypothetical protein